MALLSRVIRNLINGISQQAPSVRLDSQVEDQVNMIPDISSGLTRRNPVELDNVIAHDGSRDYTEEHAMFNYTVDGVDICIGIKPDGTVYRFDENFEGKLVQQSDTITSYLSYTDKNDLTAIETSDRLIILNRGVTVEVDFSNYTDATSTYVESTDTNDSIVDYSSTMDACFIATHGAGDGFVLENRAIIWNDDHTNYVTYFRVSGYDTTQSPENALFRRTLMEKDTNVHRMTGNQDAWYDSMPDKILVDVGYERGAENVRIPACYSAFGTIWEFKVYKGSGTANSTYDLSLAGNVALSGVTLNDALYGKWNDSEDTLDVSSFTYTDANDQVYSIETYHDGVDEYYTTDISETYRTYRVSAVIDKNMPSNVSGLPIKWRNAESLGAGTKSWIVSPEGTGVTNSDDFEYSSGGTPIYIKVEGAFNSAITAVRIANPDESFVSITSGDDLPALNRADLGSYIYNYSADSRIILGWCVENDVDNDEAWYCAVYQSVAANDNKGVINVEGEALEYDSFLDAQDVSTVDYDNGLLEVDRAIKGDYSHSITVMNGSVDYYDYKYDTIRPTDNSRSLVWITSGQINATYKIFIDDTEVASYKPTTAADATPDNIASQLKNNGTTGLDVNERYTGDETWVEGNAIIIRGLYMYNVTATCDFGDHIHAVDEARPLSKSTLTDPSILPARIPTGVTDSLGNFGSGYGTSNFLVRVNPDINNELNTYYLIYSDEYKAWVETSDYYIDSLDKTTMPVSVNKGSNDSVLIQHTNIVTPLAGDSESNPHPTFVGRTINDLVVFNGRLGYASDDTLVFSVIGDFFNIYRTTTSSYLVSDVVDLKLDSSKLGYRPIKHIFVLDNSLIINTGLSQSRLALPTNMDISSAIFTQASTFDLGNNPPLAVRRSMYFPIKQGLFTTVKVFEPDTQTGNGYTDNSSTKHCEKLIRGEVLQSVFTNDTYIVRTDDDKKTLYIQNTYVVDGTIVQNAWHKWTFAYDIKYIYARGEELKIIFEDTTNSQTIYGTINLIPKEVVEDTEAQIGYIPYLDFYTEDTTLSNLLDNMVTVDKAIGKLVTSGDANSVDGQYYESSVTLSEIVPRTQTQQGQTKIGYALLMLRRMAINMGFSGRIKVRVDRTNRSQYEHNFVPDVIGTIVVGREPVTNETARFPVNGRSQDTSVTITTDETFTPLNVTSVEWQGQLITQGGR